ncbi:bifunctional riboflavin kinase/FAD synthetase [bacterium]|nr:bifunctional riboflavin kinase/FAD synthetase [bacterium]
MADWDFAKYGRTELDFSSQPVALTIGNFDGVHLGHRHVIRTLQDFAKGFPTLALTFDPHPSSILSPANHKQCIEPLSDRVERLLSLGIDVVVVQNFDEKFASLSADDFINEYLVKEFSIKRAVIGFDFCYGARRQGDWKHFEESSRRIGFDARRAEPFMIDGSPVSSSRIRQAIQSLDLELAERLLGQPFSLSGIVVKGDQRGRELGYPTANLGIDQGSRLLPPFGVYAVEVFLPGENECRHGVMNCGVRPTIASGLKLQIETHILDYSGDLYGKKLLFRLKKFIRTEMKFSGLEQLKSQIASDTKDARIFFGV